MDKPKWAKEEHLNCIRRMISEELCKSKNWKLRNVRPESFGGAGLDREYQVFLENAEDARIREVKINFVKFGDLFNQMNNLQIKEFVRSCLRAALPDLS